MLLTSPILVITKSSHLMKIVSLVKLINDQHRKTSSELVTLHIQKLRLFCKVLNFCYHIFTPSIFGSLSCCQILGPTKFQTREVYQLLVRNDRVHKVAERSILSLASELCRNHHNLIHLFMLVSKEDYIAEELP